MAASGRTNLFALTSTESAELRLEELSPRSPTSSRGLQSSSIFRPWWWRWWWWWWGGDQRLPGRKRLIVSFQRLMTPTLVLEPEPLGRASFLR